MADEQKKLTWRQRKAIVALMEAGSIGQAAEQVGIGERTLFRWLADPTFREAYQQTREEIFGQAIARLQRLAGLAVARLAQTLVNSTSTTGQQLRAAELVLRHAQPEADIEVRAKLRGKNAGGVLMVASPVSTEEWVQMYAEVQKYQHGLQKEKAASLASEMAKRETPE